MKKWLTLFMCFSLLFGAAATASPAQAAAAYSSSFAKAAYKSPKGTYKQPASNPSSGVSKTQPTKETGTGTAATTAPKRSFTAGSFFKGMLLGGLAGMLFGGLFGGMGFMGQFLGLMVNIAAILVLIWLIRRVVVYFMNRNRYKPKRY